MPLLQVLGVIAVCMLFITPAFYLYWKLVDSINNPGTDNPYNQ
jgi:hypothetical protein